MAERLADGGAKQRRRNRCANLVLSLTGLRKESSKGSNNDWNKHVNKNVNKGNGCS